MPIVSMPNGDRVQFPDDMSKDEIKAKIRSKFPDIDESWTDSALGAVKDFGRGVGKGVVGDVVGAGQLLDPIGQYVAPGTTAAIERAGKGMKDWAMAPSASAAESVGRFGGEALPFMVGGPELAIGKGIARALPLSGKVAGTIGELVGNTAVGGAAGAVQPTKEGESHLANAAGGALTGGLLSPKIAGAAGGLMGAAGAGYGVEQLVRQFGWGPVVAALSTLGVGASHFGLSSMAHKAYRAGRYPAAVLSNAVPAGLKGAAGGQAAEGAQETYDANQPGPAQGQ